MRGRTRQGAHEDLICVSDIRYIHLMRTLVDIPEPDLRAVAEMAEQQGVSRAAIIREAVSAYLAAHPRASAAEAFGLWGTRGPDGVSLQRHLRDEW
jgi:hypothetical protein